MENQISILLESKGYTQDYLAKETGISQSYISKLCNNKCVPTLDRAYLIAKALDVPIEALIRQGQDEYSSKTQIVLSQDEVDYLCKMRMLAPEHRQAVLAVIDTYFKIKNETRILSSSREEDDNATAV